MVEVYHEEDSHPEGLNLKKTIAAAFQANFQKQERDDEQDPQSLHAAHYRLDTLIVSVRHPNTIIIEAVMKLCRVSDI